jgi:hypothetical protein
MVLFRKMLRMWNVYFQESNVTSRTVPLPWELVCTDLGNYLDILLLRLKILRNPYLLNSGSQTSRERGPPRNTSHNQSAYQLKTDSNKTICLKCSMLVPCSLNINCLLQCISLTISLNDKDG